MKKIIIYGSHYGTTKQYAEKLSELTGIETVNYEEVKKYRNMTRLFIWEVCMPVE